MNNDEKQVLQEAYDSIGRLLSSQQGSASPPTGWVNLYAAVIGEGRQETSLIWMRYSAFLVAHSLLMQPLLRDWRLSTTAPPQLVPPTIVIPAAIAGLLLTMLWWFLNYAGWSNQNLKYTYAFRVQPPGVDPSWLPTNWWRDSDKRRPWGPIYWTAQACPMMMALAYCIFLGWGIYSLGASVNCAVLAALLAAAMAVSLTAWGCHRIDAFSKVLDHV